MNKSRKEELTPVHLDMTDGTLRDTVDMVISTEEAKRLQTAAKELGGFSISILAEEGDPYRTTYEMNGRRVTSVVMNVPTEQVIVSMQNVANPNAPADLHELWSRVV